MMTTPGVDASRDMTRWALTGAVLYDRGRDDRRFSPHCWRVRMALAHKGLDCELQPEDQPNFRESWERRFGQWFERCLDLRDGPGRTTLGT